MVSRRSFFIARIVIRSTVINANLQVNVDRQNVMFVVRTGIRLLGTCFVYLSYSVLIMHYICIRDLSVGCGQRHSLKRPCVCNFEHDHHQQAVCYCVRASPLWDRIY